MEHGQLISKGCKTYLLSSGCQGPKRLFFVALKIKLSAEVEFWNTLILFWYFLICLIFFYFKPYSFINP